MCLVIVSGMSDIIYFEALDYVNFSQREFVFASGGQVDGRQLNLIQLGIELISSWVSFF